MDHAIVADAKSARAIVTFKAHGKDRRARQHSWIGGTVRHMAGLAPVDAN